jgi:hypothetical protein
MKRKHILLKTILLFSISSCNLKNADLQFYDCQYHPKYYETGDFWIENPEENVKSKIEFLEKKLNERDLDSLYQTKAHYLFSSAFTSAKKCRADIINDTLYISFKPKKFNDPLAEPSPTTICLEINKLKYPNYKNVQVKFKAR